MLTHIKMFFKSFYDHKFVKKYVEKTTGSGSAHLATLALFTSLIFVVLALHLRFTLDNGSVFYLTKPFFDQVEKVHIIDGELQWEDNVVQKIDMPKISIIIDTTGQTPNLRGIEQNGLYITKTRMLLVSNGESIRSVIFKELNKMSGNDNLFIDHSTFSKVAQKYLERAFIILASSLAISIFLISWLIYIVTAFIVAVIGLNIKKGLQGLGLAANRRLAAAAITPPAIISVIIHFSPITVSVILLWVITTVVGIAIFELHAPYFETKEKTKEKKVKVVAKKTSQKKVAPASKKIVTKTPAKKSIVKKDAEKKTVKKVAAKKTVAKKPVVKKKTTTKKGAK